MSSEPPPPALRRRARAAAIGFALACGCDVGPRYVAPAVSVPPDFKETSPAAYRGLSRDVWAPARPADAEIKGKWWEMFDESELDGLEERLGIDNQTVAQYFQNFMAARAQVGVARAGYFPTVSINPVFSTGGGAAGATAAGAAAGGTGVSGVSSAAGTSATGGSSQYFAVPLEATWAPDLWDRVRNTVRESRYAAQVSAADLENERLTEEAALAEYYFELRGQDSLKELYGQTIAADRRSLELTRAQAETGVGTEEAVAQAEVTLRNAEATAIGIATNRALYEHAIATLIGKPASEFAMPERALATPVPPIPVGIPSRLLERRPDIAAAERTVAQANALVGVGKAAYYPSLNLAATGGFASFSLGTLFSIPALFWSLGASASETIFEGGLRSATVAEEIAEYKADVAAYRQTVLTAFQQVEDYAATLRILSQQIFRQKLAVESAQRYLYIAKAQYETGLEPYLDVITAETLLLGDQQTLVTLRVDEMTAAVELVQALGGGWDRARLPSAAQVTSKKAMNELLHPVLRP